MPIGKPIAIKSLDQELYSDFETLRREREATDTMIEEWTEKISAEWLRARCATMRCRTAATGTFHCGWRSLIFSIIKPIIAVKSQRCSSSSASIRE